MARAAVEALNWGVIAIIAPMPNELRPVVKLLGLSRDGEVAGMPAFTGVASGTRVVATRTGIGPDPAERVTEALLAAHDVERVLVTGIAGGIRPASVVGDLVVPEEVIDGRTGARYRATPVGDVTPRGVIRTGSDESFLLDDDDLRAMQAEGVVALDMETAAIAAVCHRRGVPWLAFRAISDMAGSEGLDPVMLTLVDSEGNPKARAALRFLLTHPHRIPMLLKIGRDATRATTQAAGAAVRTLATG